MSEEENVKIAQAAFAAWNEGDMDALRELYHPDAISRPLEGWPEAELAIGRDTIMRAFELIRDAFDADRLEPITEFRGIADRVVVRAIWHGIGRGPDPNMDMTFVYMIRQGRIFEFESFWDYADALEALGLQ